MNYRWKIIDIARGSDFEAVLDRMVLLKTLRYMDGVLICPRQYCDYAGWVRPNFTCDRPLECELCGYTWRSMQLLPLYRRVFHCIKSLATGQEDSLSFVWKAIWTKACPVCNTPIEKDGGSPQMHVSAVNYTSAGFA